MTTYADCQRGIGLGGAQTHGRQVGQTRLN